MRTKTNRNLTRSLIAAACALACFSAEAAKIVITSRDAPGVGFNDPTPVSPVGGNPGTTLGQQRLHVYRYVADIWEKNLQSNVDITVSAGWEALTCTSSSAVLGSAGAWNLWHDFPGGKAGTWYPQALANKIAGVNLSGNEPEGPGEYNNVDIKTQFNVNLGNPGCLDGSPFYLGLDGNAGTKVNFVETLLHELGHGLGFAVSTVQTSTGYRYAADGSGFGPTGGLPSVWESFMFDNTKQKSWLQMTNAERKASAINPLQLAWTGGNAVAGATMLKATQQVKTSSLAPSGNTVADISPSLFGPVIPTSGNLGVLANITAQAGEVGPGCDPFNAANRAAVFGKVPVISRGGCAFAIKVKNAQDAGAVGVLLANNTTGAFTPGGTDSSVTIPSGGIAQAAGDALKAAIKAAVPYGSRLKPGTVAAAFGIDSTRISGADSQGRPLLYTPATLAPGSSVSHWDVTATPNLLMEPNISTDLGTVLTPPKDLTLPLLKDIGW
ncbi:PA domain-containing protein [Massilia sp. YIM B04103]|uniref:PA domain-containing protein n=1 Tax=Massilia sp. YIM B04103 TaxID=2963106 RepID=UPI00210B98DD|nr:PA domain-containing protein [Massilia sp. YIM B04103]